VVIEKVTIERKPAKPAAPPSAAATNKPAPVGTAVEVADPHKPAQ
jgi:hypothetical protein